MTDLIPFLKSLLAAPGLSAHEGPVADLIRQRWQPLVDEIHLSRLGSLHALKRGTASEPRPSLLIATHMDAIGLMVRQVVDGFLRVVAVGGVDARILPGTPVMVYASGSNEELPGVVALPSARLLPEKVGDGVVGLEYLWVDVGLSPREVSKRIRVGDLVAFNTEPVEMSGGIVSGHSLDNRASVAALTFCLEELQTKSHRWDVWAAATTQEEVTLGGATTSAFQLRPQLAIAVDVTFAKGPGANGWETFPLGKGPTLTFGPNIHPFLHRRFKEIAERLEIPHALEPTPRHSGTDAMALQVAAEGIPTMVMGIPLRYMHTPVEMVALPDIQRAGRLLAEFIATLEVDFVEKIAWDE